MLVLDVNGNSTQSVSHASVLHSNSTHSVSVLQAANFLNNNDTQLDTMQHLETSTFTFLFLTTLMCNLMALYIIYIRKPDRPSAKFTAGLCLENACVGGTLLIFLISSSMTKDWVNNDAWCIFMAVLFISHILATSWLGLLISIDRFVAIRNSLKYSKRMTHRTCVLLMVFTLIISLAISLLQLVDRTSVDCSRGKLSVCIIDSSTGTTYWKMYMLAIIGMTFVLPLVLNCYIYWSIYKVTKYTTALARRNSLQPAAGLLESKEKNDNDQVSVESQQQNSRPGQGIRKLSGQLLVHKDNRKAAKMGILVVVLELTTFLPFSFVIFLQIVSSIQTSSSSYQWLAVACILVDCVANPIIYVLRNKSSRMTIRSSCQTSSRFSTSTEKDRTVATHNSPVPFRLITSQASDDSVHTAIVYN